MQIQLHVPNHKIRNRKSKNVKSHMLTLQCCLPNVVDGKIVPTVAVILLMDPPQELPKPSHGACDILASNHDGTEDVASWYLEVGINYCSSHSLLEYGLATSNISSQLKINTHLMQMRGE